MSDQWLTYDEAAITLGVSPNSLRHRVRRQMWPKQMSEGGRALVLVPPDATCARSVESSEHQNERAVRPARKVSSGKDLVALKARIAELRADLDLARRERDIEHEERLRERDRVQQLTEQIATVARTLASNIAEAEHREEQIRRQVSRAEADLKTTKSRTWWGGARRLF